MSIAPQGIVHHAREFAQEVFDRTSSELVISAYGNRMAVGDMFAMFGLFRERGAQIRQEAEALPGEMTLDERVAWRSFARAHYSVRVQELFQKMLVDWKNRVPSGFHDLYDTAIEKSIPLAAIALIFPEQLSIRGDQIASLQRVFTLLAQLAGLAPVEKPAALPGLGG